MSTASDFTAVVALIGMVVSVVGMAGMVVWAVIETLRWRRPRNTPPPSRPSTDWTTLTYCQSCGCNHRAGYMDWLDDGRYRCCVCCRNKP